MRSKVAMILKGENDQKNYLNELKEIVAIDAAAGRNRTPRTRYIAGTSALVLAEQTYDRCVEVRLAKPFETNLRKKKELMKASSQAFNKLLEYEVGEVTAAATFYLAELNAHFSKALTESERPDGLNELEMQEYELAIEEQAYPFEEKAIRIHEKNLELISLGIYNAWIDKSLEKLAKLVPARYDKPEVASEIVTTLDTYAFEIERAPLPAVAAGGEAVAAGPPSVGADDEDAAEYDITDDEIPVSGEVPPADLSLQQGGVGAPHGKGGDEHGTRHEG
jgi:hypothetical protein